MSVQHAAPKTTVNSAKTFVAFACMDFISGVLFNHIQQRVDKFNRPFMHMRRDLLFTKTESMDLCAHMMHCESHASPTRGGEVPVHAPGPRIDADLWLSQTISGFPEAARVAKMLIGN